MDGAKSTKTYKFQTSDGQVLHVEESGNLKAAPLLFLHGGPGASIGQSYQWLLSNHEFRVIAFDQRGCGRSQPFGLLENNTTQHHIADIEGLRKYFGIEKWVVFGGSWGSTLALNYAIDYPQHVSALVLRGIFLGRPEDAQWFISSKNGASQVFPKEYAEFAGGYTNKIGTTQLSLCEWYFDQLTSSQENTRNDAAKRWFDWEGSISKLEQMKVKASDYASKQQIYTLALFECYYLLNNCFMPENHILSNCHRIAHIPTHIVHGRYDMVCKCEGAIQLQEHLPNAHLSIVENAGHSMAEKGISEALVDALHTITKQLSA